MDLLFILTKLCVPVIGALGMALAIPYIIARSLVPALGECYTNTHTHTHTHTQP